MSQILLDRSDRSILTRLVKSLTNKWLKQLAIVTSILVFTWLLSAPAFAGIEDDKYDGNVFVLYAGNGSLVPAKISLADSLRAKKPALIVFYVDDSTDCKKYSTTISQLQGYYGKAASFIPVTVDSLALDKKYPETEAGYYYGGTVPQTVVVDKNGKVQLNEAGLISFEKVDDAMRNVFDLLPRKDSVELKRRSFNEFNSELAK
ncbi:thylakoid membrane photosystem I accumulation factor [Chamaesiphon sp. GL140_3_metabinner_50]|uniref:thylakoid membrane photosystem I accumulation factor n=1 Tax=Chamaesiphon sp. GL140_3_metabinner_50 TaxID=2970812 RepID=UPI0025F6DBD1|nr:thylakoid membrane photosystem I accumulation factor [Chamaesiphon sp. GL140_3_metabinner_50]